IPNIMVNTATSKLVSSRKNQASQDHFKTQSPADFIRMIAVLAPRLSLTIGPYTSEASELIASHLAVLTRTDSENHFFRTLYPSEPILAEASARLTYGNGWAGPLSALVHYVRGGVVEAGFKGELLTKIVCLMAMDNVLGQAVIPEGQWQFSRPVTVSEFLNHLIIPLHDHSTFSEGLKGVQFGKELQPGTLNIDDTKLRRFLDGYVFFNHFIRVEVKLSYSMLVHAWNRGAAIMCMTNTKGIDHVIPVMLDTTGDIIFGPLHGPWEKEHIQQARQHLSYILINSKNYASGKDQIQAARAAKFSARNLREYRDSFDQATESDLSDETESQDKILQEDLEVDSQYLWPDEEEPNIDIGTIEKMKDVERGELEMDNVFLSLIQIFAESVR